MPSTRVTDLCTALADLWLTIRDEYEAAHEDRRLLLTATHRPPEEQWRLYKIGRRELPDGSWVEDDDASTRIVTYLDGFKKASKHNMMPAEALDFAVMVGGKVSWDHREYEPVGALAVARGLVWGGAWTRLKDYPHIEIPQ